MADLIGRANEILHIGQFRDFGPNGLQVPGRHDVSHIVSGVSVNMDLLERAVAVDADLVIAHHGLLWDFQSRRFSPRHAARLRLALGAEINVAMYHLPLDAHPELGNNALIADRLGLLERQSFGVVRERPMGLIGRLPRPMDLARFVSLVEDVMERTPLVLPHGRDTLERVAVLSGGGANQLGQAIAAGADIYLTGEAAEQSQGEAREGGIHFVAAGHHATETFGISALGDTLAEEFSVRHTFINVLNPV